MPSVKMENREKTVKTLSGENDVLVSEKPRLEPVVAVEIRMRDVDAKLETTRRVNGQSAEFWQ